jgi:cation:H+ antiporter
MSQLLLEFTVSALLVVAAGVVLTWCADTIAARTGLGRLLVGSILLAAATSLPELTTNISAVRLGLPDLAVGNLIGSSLFNLAFLALADLLHRTRGQLLSPLAAAHALAGTVTIVLTALVGMGVLWESQPLAPAVGRLGLSSIAVLVAYALCARLVYYDQRLTAQARPVAAEAMQQRGGSLSRAICGFMIAAGIIFLVAPWLASAAGRLAERSGLGGTFVGTTLVAFFTSLPELVATLAAVRMGAVELAIGNIFGSNAFNMILVAPLDLFSSKPLLATVSVTHVLTCFAVILVTSVVLLGQLYRVERRVWLLEPDAALVLALVIGALFMVFLLG